MISTLMVVEGEHKRSRGYESKRGGRKGLSWLSVFKNLKTLGMVTT